MRVVLSAFLAVALMTAAAIAETATSGAKQEVAEAPPPAGGPPTHFLPRPSQLMQAFGNYMHTHHQDTAAAHHTSHAQHHVDAHGATPPGPPPPPPPPGPVTAGAAAGAGAGAAAGAAAAAAVAPPPGPVPPHAAPPPPPSHIGSHLQQAGIGQGDRPGLFGMGGMIGNHHQGTHHPEPPRPITATRTVFVEVTKRVTRHPVCMTVYGERPPCLPYNEYKPSPYKKPIDDYRHSEKNQEAEKTYRMEEEDDVDYNDMVDGYYINPTQVVRMGEATAVADSMFNGNVLRNGRYIQFASAAPAATVADPAKSDDAAVATPALEDAPVEAPAQEQRQGPLSGMAAGLTQFASNMGSMMPQMPQLPMMPLGPLGPMSPPRHTPETRYELKTLWVTKVERFTDYRVTATLVAENCVPTDSKIPFCNSGYSGPSYEAGDDYTPAYTDKPTIITTPRPPKKPGYPDHPPAPPHARPPPRPHHRPHHRPPPTTPAPYPAPPAYPPAAYPPPPVAPVYPPPPAPAYPAAPAPAYPPAPAPAPAYPPAPAPAYPPPAAPAYPPAPAPAYPAAPAPAYPPPPAAAEPVHDYPVDTHRDEHWKETDKAQAQEMAMEAPSA